MSANYLKLVVACVIGSGIAALWGTGRPAVDAAVLLIGGVMVPMTMLVVGLRVWGPMLAPVAAD